MSVSQARAASIRGFVTVRGAQVFLRPISTTLPRSLSHDLPITASISVRSALLDLKTDDFVVVSGALVDSDHDGRPDVVQVEGIESVGLKSILGNWRSDNWEVVRFEDFTRMSLYRPKPEGALRGAPLSMNPMSSLKRLGFSKLKELNYTLAPERGSAYSIFLVEKKPGGGPAPVYVGRLDVQNRALKLEIYNTKTGEASEVLSLSPVRD